MVSENWKAIALSLKVEKGANYTLRNGRGKTPMEEAVESEHETCIEILSEASGRMFEAMVLLRKEKEQLKRRIDELNVEHERAMSHSRQVHQLQSKQQAHMYKDKIRNATADMAHEHEVAMGRKRLDLGSHKKKGKKKHVKEDYKELNKVNQRKQIDKLRDSAMSSDVEKSHELHDRADRATKTFISMDPEKLKDKCKNKKCSIDPKKK